MTNSLGEVLLMTNEDRLRPLIQRLIDLLGLRDGEVSLCVHEGTVHKLEIQALWVIRKDGRSTANPPRRICYTPLPERVRGFVVSELEGPVLQCVGRYGTLTVWATGGTVTGADYTRKWKP